MAAGARELARGLSSLAKLSAIVGIGAFTAENCLYNVDGGERAVIFDRFRGILPEPKGEGTHIKIPFIQYPTVIDIRSTPRVISSLTGTKDLQQVNISLRVLTRPHEDHIPQLYSELGENFYDRILPSLGNEVLKSVVAQYNADQLLTTRDKVSRQIADELRSRARQFNLTLDDVAITHLTYGHEFTRAVELKEVANQEAERSKFVVMMAEEEKKADIIRAEGESEAAKLISDAISKGGDGFVEVQRIDTSKTIAENLAKSRNVTYLPSSKGNNGILLGVNN